MILNGGNSIRYQCREVDEYHMSLIDFMKEDPEWVEIIDLKKCIKCNRELPQSHYTKASGRPYTRTECRECNNKASKLVKKLKNNNKPPDDYRCPGCNKTEEECRGLGGKKVGTWCLDHDHKTKEFRGWLCHKCNRGLGAFEDNIETMKRMIKYLENGKK